MGEVITMEGHGKWQKEEPLSDIYRKWITGYFMPVNCRCVLIGPVFVHEDNIS